MISAEVKKAGLSEGAVEVEVHLDREGLGDLLAQLAFLSSDKTDHVHLMSESWGGTHLADAPRGRDAISIRHLKIVLVD